jgi:hypothetical protein
MSYCERFAGDVNSRGVGGGMVGPGAGSVGDLAWAAWPFRGGRRLKLEAACRHVRQVPVAGCRTIRIFAAACLAFPGGVRGGGSTLRRQRGRCAETIHAEGARGRLVATGHSDRWHLGA